MDKASVKGIWHNKDEAWAGIDELFPTVDDPVRPISLFCMRAAQGLSIY